MDALDSLQTGGELNRKTFLSHVFSTSEEGKAEFMNVIQYSCLGVIPIVILNKLIQRFVPEADPEKSSLELFIEVFLQVIIMFCGIVLIHRTVSYIPTYSGFKYESLNLTNVILAFLVIVLSIQTKLGLKVNILVERLDELWNGPVHEKKESKSHAPVHHISQADYMGSGPSNDMFPPAPVVSNRTDTTNYNQMAASTSSSMPEMDMGPMPANTMGSAFGAFY